MDVKCATCTLLKEERSENCKINKFLVQIERNMGISAPITECKKYKNETKAK